MPWLNCNSIYGLYLIIKLFWRNFFSKFLIFFATVKTSFWPSLANTSAIRRLSVPVALRKCKAPAAHSQGWRTTPSASPAHFLFPCVEENYTWRYSPLQVRPVSMRTKRTRGVRSLASAFAAITYSRYGAVTLTSKMDRLLCVLEPNIPTEGNTPTSVA